MVDINNWKLFKYQSDYVSDSPIFHALLYIYSTLQRSRLKSSGIFKISRKWDTLLWQNVCTTFSIQLMVWMLYNKRKHIAISWEERRLKTFVEWKCCFMIMMTRAWLSTTPASLTPCSYKSPKCPICQKYCTIYRRTSKQWFKFYQKCF